MHRLGSLSSFTISFRRLNTNPQQTEAQQRSTHTNNATINRTFASRVQRKWAMKAHIAFAIRMAWRNDHNVSRRRLHAS